MRIAMIGQKGMPARFGGVEKHVHDLSIGLVERGFDVTAYARSWYTEPSITSYKGVHIKHVRTLKSKHFDAIIHTFFATIDAIRHPYDVVHYHGVGPSLLSWMIRVFAPQTKVITTFHCIDRKHAKWGFIARLALLLGEWSACKFAHTTIAVSKTIQQYVRDVYDCSAAFVPNAVNIQRKTTKQDVISQWNLESGKYVLLVSRFIAHKGIHYLIDAWKQLSQESPELIDDLKLVIVGDGYHSDDYVEFLHTLAQGEKNIVFTGFQSGDDLRQIYSHAHAMVHPSDNEGLPIVVLEGMSYGLPVLVSDIPEHRDLIHNYKYLFQAGSVPSLKESLRLLLEKPKKSLQEEGKKNKQHIQDEYEWKRIITETIDIYSNSSLSETNLPAHIKTPV